jgi:hypothetical protein
MQKRIVLAIFVATIMLSLSVAQVFAGGPVCPPRAPMCAPPVCAPQMCAPPVCVPAPVCGPVPCAPPPPCGPVACGPPPCPPRCEENPLAMIVKGTVKLVVGVASLPFKVVDCLFGGDDCFSPRCYPKYNRMAMCAPPPCMPPVCGPMGYPGMGYGMGMGRPAGFGYGVQKRRMVPFAKKKETLPSSLMATQADGIFGGYW